MRAATPTVGCVVNVLSVIHYPVFGGPHNRNELIAPLLSERGIRLTVLLPDEPGNAVARLRASSVEVETMGLHRVRARANWRLHVGFLRGFWREVSQIRALIRQRAIDVVLINGLVNPHAAVAARLEGVPVVWQILDLFAPMWFRRGMMHMVRRLGDVLMVTGHAVAEGHPGATAFAERLVYFFPPVDTRVFKADASLRAAARWELGIGPNEFVIGNVNNLSPMKGHIHFIRAAAKLRSKTAGLRFVILGASYGDRADYEAMLWGEAKALGLRLGRDFVVCDPGDRVAELEQAFDLFWLTSEPRSESVSTALGEAMALGLPVIASDIGAIGETIDDGTSGVLVPAGDPDAIVAATNLLLDKPEVRGAMGATARASAVRRWALEACAGHHIDAFQMAVARQRDGCLYK